MWKYRHAAEISPKTSRPVAAPGTKLLTSVLYTSIMAHIRMPDDESSSDVQRWFTEAIRRIWPVATGSLSLRKGPCIRKNCPACAAGRGHSSHALYVRRGSRRLSIYVPERLVPEVRKAIQNGRLLQDLINEAGVRYVSALKNEEPPTARE